ncbi:hypothetical protein ANCCEY_09680 [Ancylostoma ceylanicum]|uniref:Uncharacterized protein n=1 Tax=Ancylostoma ceylanicum TaxID=53326 RepID=A0A0D6LJ47_9BILA|nr:hypothetical protein ANCCEY_09680 [Ancylostoma ceylanicum]
MARKKEKRMSVGENEFFEVYENGKPKQGGLMDSGQEDIDRRGRITMLKLELAVTSSAMAPGDQPGWMEDRRHRKQYVDEPARKSDIHSSKTMWPKAGKPSINTRNRDYS